MPSYRVIIEDSNFPLISTSFYIDAPDEPTLQAFLDAQYENAFTISSDIGPTNIGGGSSGTPIFIASGETFTTSSNAQSVAVLAIDCEGVVDVSNGVLAFT